MNIDELEKRLEALNADPVLQNFIAQSNARYILLNTGESKENFPPYTIDNERLNILALQYLNIGCDFAESGSLDRAIIPLERGAHLLETVHGSVNNAHQTSNYYGLIGALAYYVSFQYSKSFILIGKFAVENKIASLIRWFLNRNFGKLNDEAYSIVLSTDYQDEEISKDHLQEGSRKIYEVVIAKALSNYVKYLQSGDRDLLDTARQQLKDLKEIAEIEQDPGIWWVIRLLLLISEGFNHASIWNVLTKHFDMNDPDVEGFINGLVYMPPRGIYELFITQRKSLQTVLNDGQNGCIVSIPTSSGKTRIAEIAILNSILKYPGKKVLYIAPFRSLAFEIETSMERTFQNTSITVSHLYGGNSYSPLDQVAIDEASLIIATPEKAKAILRGNPELFQDIQLVIIDEGHLLGDNKRLIVNEIFFEELRYFIKLNHGRFLLLSAVLPNAEDLAEWLTDSKETVFRDTWRPSDERLGILDWNNGSVSLYWESLDSERSSFNPRFIVQSELPWQKWQRKAKFHPANKNEAVAATAYKLKSFGPVLIFVGQKASVFVMANAYLKAMGDDPADHQWKQKHDWRAFEMACEETYGEQDHRWLSFARKGILCHNSDLHSDVRLPLERLMRSDKPVVIISTSTLGQGVNLGVSTVIFSTTWQSGQQLNARDFWNIAGRAGRAFVDHEGKILIATESSNMGSNARKKHFDGLREYFNKERIDIAQSGILVMIKRLKELAIENHIELPMLLTLITENRIDELGEGVADFEEKLDWIDDTLLSLQLEHNPEGEIDVSWTEIFFSRSLAAIQAAHVEEISASEILSFIKSRVVGITEKVGSDREKWKSITKSGIPLNSDLILEDKLERLIEIVTTFTGLDRTADNYVLLLKEIESEINTLPVIVAESRALSGPEIDSIREKWIKGVALSEIMKHNHGLEAVTEIYTFVLPWVLNGIAKKMRNIDFSEEALWIEELALLVEAGLPSLLKVKIYRAGIRSRMACNELGDLLGDDVGDLGVNSIKKSLVANLEEYKADVSNLSGEWLELLSRNTDRRVTKVSRVAPFKFAKVHEKTKVLVARSINGEQYLISPDFSFVFKGAGNVDFTGINNLPGITFRYRKRDGKWHMSNINPYINVIRQRGE